MARIPEGKGTSQTAADGQQITSEGEIEGRSVTRSSGKGPYLAMIFLAAVWAGLAVTGFVSFGGHEWSWSVGALGKVGLIASIYMMAVGGGFAALFLAGGIAGVKSEKQLEAADQPTLQDQQGVDLNI